MYVFIFRRDFRLVDNLGFIKCICEAKKHDQEVLPIFIYNKTQIDPDKNKYFSNNSMQFLVESIRSLEDQLRAKGGVLHKFLVNSMEEEADVILSMIPKVTHVYTNMDLTPFARQRDDMLKTKLTGQVSFSCIEDYTLFRMDEPKTKTQSGSTYQVFSFLYKKIDALHKIIPKVSDLPFNLDTIMKKSNEIGMKKKKKKINDEDFFTPNDDLAVNGGRDEGLKRLATLEKNKFRDYEDSRNEMANENGTTRLSAYLKYGCLSIREVYWMAFKAYGLNNPINRELFFREFYYNIVWNHPRVLKGMFQMEKKKKNKKNESFTDLGIQWDTSPKAIKNFEAWKNGKTGVPLVDAGMRQMNATGFMHNRARMVTSMFLIKNLFIDWRWGEKYFASRLVDYDPSQNNAGWIWSSSLAPYATPYYRTMNPYIQQQRFDKDAEYVKKWVPELKDVPVKNIALWENEEMRTKKIMSSTDYPKPIIEDHTSVVSNVEKKYKELYKEKKKKKEKE